jgi:hypothetical protein
MNRPTRYRFVTATPTRQSSKVPSDKATAYLHQVVVKSRSTDNATLVLSIKLGQARPLRLMHPQHPSNATASEARNP